MLNRFNDFTHDDFAERRGDGLEFFDLKAGHGERFSQLAGAQGRVAEFAQPGFRKLHDEPCSLIYWNCDKKRISPSKNKRKSFTP